MASLLWVGPGVAALSERSLGLKCTAWPVTVLSPFQPGSAGAWQCCSSSSRADACPPRTVPRPVCLARSLTLLERRRALHRVCNIGVGAPLLVPGRPAGSPTCCVTRAGHRSAAARWASHTPAESGDTSQECALWGRNSGSISCCFRHPGTALGSLGRGRISGERRGVRMSRPRPTTLSTAR